MSGSRSRGRRYDTEPKLNMKKVFAVILAVIILIMFIFIIKGIFSKESDRTNISSLSYFASFKDNKWGVIDSNGNEVVTPGYQEMIVIPNHKKDVFLCTFDVNYDSGEYSTKALNSKNEEIFTDYDNIEAISNKDSSNQLWYESNVLKVEKGGKYGIINLDGKVIFEPQYDSIEAVQGIENAYRVQSGNLYGIVDSDGNKILESKYTEIVNLGEDNKAGYIVRDENGKYGIVDYSANVVLENKYDSISKVHANDYYVVVQDGTRKLVYKDGTDRLVTGFDDIVEVLKNQENGVIFTLGGKYGVMNMDGAVTIPAEYDELKEAKTGVLIARSGQTYGVIDMQRTEKIPFQYSNISYNDRADIYFADTEDFNTTIYNNNFEAKITGMLLDCDNDNGYMKIAVGEDIRYYNFRFEEKSNVDVMTSHNLFVSKKDGKYGFVDKDGKVVVDYIYDDATEQNDYGYAAVNKDGKWGSIDSRGNVVQEPVYNLNEYLMIDFIGKWHMGKDINMEYYNQEDME